MVKLCSNSKVVERIYVLVTNSSLDAKLLPMNTILPNQITGNVRWRTTVNEIDKFRYYASIIVVVFKNSLVWCFVSILMLCNQASRGIFTRELIRNKQIFLKLYPRDFSKLTHDGLVWQTKTKLVSSRPDSTWLSEISRFQDATSSLVNGHFIQSITK